MIDIVNEISAIRREVDPPGTVTLTRTYEADIEDVWDALTDPERIRRWFLPISGDLREGGAFQLEGNAGGTILTCDRPQLLKVTFGMETSIVEVRLSALDKQTTLVLEHSVPADYAPPGGEGALYVGPGWDGAVLALGLYLRGEIADDPVAAASSPESQRFCRESIGAWAAVVEALGLAAPEQLADAVKAAMAQFAPDLAD
ncbi:SRPBCC family protein [Streptosporangiaceae bacterium NEAU-GS5]|nr:SRPBCC family protein [Streptosporangiaceae bacterium NEAU-GS5]